MQVLADQGKQPSPSDSGKTEREIEALVDAVHGHARALVLLAREVVRQGVTATTRDLGHVMQALERRNPGDRENSLYASVELSLRRLTAEQRRQVRVLGVCHGGVHMSVLEALPGLDSDKAKALATALIDVGLGEDMGQGHLRLDPALAPYLLRELSPTELAETRAKWVAAMRWLTGALYRQRSLDTALAAELALLELPNFLAMLERMQHEATPEILVDTADSVERQISHLSQPLALAWVSSLRASAASQLGEWNHSRYLHESANIERMLERGDNTGVLAAARSLLDRDLRAGEQAYMDAPYDIAVTYFHLGRVLQMGGSAAEGLRTLQQARQRFDELARKGDASAQDMASNCISESGDCLRDLGRTFRKEMR